MKKILLIDDNAEFKAMVSDYFRFLNFEVISADGGEEGIKAAKEHSPDIIFLDVMMPGKSGIEVIRELQAHEETSEIPVLVITGTYFEKGVWDLFKVERNCKEFLTKTVDLPVLRRKVEELLEK